MSTMLKHYIAAMILGAALLAPALASAQSISPARAAAVHECSVLSSRYPEYISGTTQMDTYRACMAQHGQIE